MIRRLRRRHRASWLVLAVLVPAGVAAGLLGRAPEPIVAELPASLAGAPAAGTAPLLAPLVVETDAGPLELRLALEAAGPERALLLRATRAPLRPDVLVYWSADGPHADAGPRGELPPGARLLGPLAGTRTVRLPLPPEATAADGTLAGRLWLYSLGHQELVGSAPLAAVGSGGSGEDR